MTHLCLTPCQQAQLVAHNDSAAVHCGATGEIVEGACECCEGYAPVPEDVRLRAAGCQALPGFE